MRALRIPLSAVLDRSVTLDEEVAVEELRPAGAAGVSAERIRVTGQLSARRGWLCGRADEE